MSFGPDRTIDHDHFVWTIASCLACGAEVWSIDQAVDRDGHPDPFDREDIEGEPYLRPHHCPAEPEPEPEEYDDLGAW